MSRNLFVYHLCIDSCEKESNKREAIVESQAYCEGKQETSVHEILSNGLYLWLGIFESTNC